MLAWVLRSSPIVRASACSSSQLLSSGPPATRELSALEIGDRPDRRIRRRHHGAERARIGIEDQVVAERPLARNPQPVRDDEIGGAAFSAILPASVLASSGVSMSRSAFLSRPWLDDVELPGERAGLLRNDANAIGCDRAGSGKRRGAYHQ